MIVHCRDAAPVHGPTLRGRGGCEVHSRFINDGKSHCRINIVGRHVIVEEGVLFHDKPPQRIIRVGGEVCGLMCPACGGRGGRL